MKRISYLHVRAGKLAFFLALVASLSAAQTTTTTFTGVSLTVHNATIPPGGMFQFQLMLTEPKPISNSSTRPTTSTSSTGTVSGISLNDPIGVTAGVAVIDDTGVVINTTSPLATFGTNPDLDYPILTIAMPVLDNAVVGSQYPMTIDVASSFWLDPLGQPYPQEIKPGKLTIGGTLAISGVVPGGGSQPAGTRISIFGIGFLPTSRVDLAGVTLTAADYTVVSPTQLDVILPEGVQMDGERVRVKNKNGEVSEYFSYLRTQALGQSANPLVAKSYPLFSRRKYTSAALTWIRSGSQFTALALQNPGPIAANVTLSMLSADNQVLDSFSIPLPALSKITRDLAEFFAQPPDAATSVLITSDQKIQVLGLLGANAIGSVTPIIVSVP